MTCTFDSCELWNGLLLGVISSALFALLFHLGRGYFYFRRRYGKLAGEYDGYGFRTDNAHELVEKPISSATIRYLAENKLEISVKHDGLTWVGEISMNSAKYGVIAFQYEDSAQKHFFGFKKCIVEKDFKTMYVIGDESKGYGTEVFKRT